MRNRVSHGYFDIDLDVVWNTVTRDLPKLQESVTRILSELSGSRRETGTSPSGTVRTRSGIEPGRSRLALGPGPPLSPWPGRRPDRLGDNDGMASDDSKAPSLLRLTLMLLDGARPSGTLGWVSATKQAAGCLLFDVCCTSPLSTGLVGCYEAAAL